MKIGFIYLNKRNGHIYAASRTDYQIIRGLIGQIAHILECRDSCNLSFDLSLLCIFPADSNRKQLHEITVFV